MKTSNQNVLAIVSLLLLSAPALAAEYKPSTDGKAVFENIHVASMCARGFAVAVHNFGEDKYKSSQVDAVIELAKRVCIEDSHIISLYNSMKNGPDAMTLEESKVFAEKSVAKLISENLKILRKAEVQMERQPTKR